MPRCTNNTFQCVTLRTGFTVLQLSLPVLACREVGSNGNCSTPAAKTVQYQHENEGYTVWRKDTFKEMYLI